MPKHLLKDSRFYIKIGISFLIAAFFGVWVHKQGIALLPSAELLSIVVRNWWGPAGFVLILITVHILRAYRWLYLLRPLSETPVRLGSLLAIAFVGFMAIMLLPLRTGEVARPYLISMRSKISVSAAFATIAIERVIDGLILSGTLTICLLLIPQNSETPAWSTYGGIATLGIFVTASVVLALLLWKGEQAVSSLERLGALVSTKFSKKLTNVLRGFLKGLLVIPDRNHLIPFVLMSIAYWGINGAGMWFLAWSCGLPISFIGGLTIMTILGVGILIPTGPGHLGNFQAAVAASLSLLGLTEVQRVDFGSVFIFVLYLGILGVTVSAGIFSLLTEHISLTRVVGPTASIDERRDESSKGDDRNLERHQSH